MSYLIIRKGYRELLISYNCSQKFMRINGSCFVKWLGGYLLISVIVPIYNVEKYLNKCIESLLSQTYKDIEIILVNDGSTDGCINICKYYQQRDKRIVVIDKLNGGVCSARNIGLSVAKGEYIAFCDSDDYVACDWLEVLFSKMISEKGDAICSGYSYIDTDGSLLYEYPPEMKTSVLKNEQRVFSLITSILLGKARWGVYLWLFKRSNIIGNNITFCESCENFAEDLGFVLENLLYVNKVVFTDYAGYNYCRRKNSMMALSEETVKFNSLNEISHQFGVRYIKWLSDNRKAKRDFSVIHFLIMYNQYMKVYYNSKKLQLVNKYIHEIKSISWYKKWTRRTVFSYYGFKKILNGDKAVRIVLFSFYLSTGSWHLYRLFYRVYCRFLAPESDSYLLLERI